MIRLARIDHVGLRVEALDEAPSAGAASSAWSSSRDGEVVHLACDDEPYCLELSAAGGGAVGIEHVAWELHPDCDLDAARAHLERLGIEVDEDIAGGLTCRDLDGNRIQLLPARARTGIERYVQHAGPRLGPGPRESLGTSTSSLAGPRSRPASTRMHSG